VEDVKIAKFDATADICGSDATPDSDLDSADICGSDATAESDPVRPSQPIQKW
jgi:hypothetical protein